MFKFLFLYCSVDCFPVDGNVFFRVELIRFDCVIKTKVDWPCVYSSSANISAGSPFWVPPVCVVKQHIGIRRVVCDKMRMLS